MFWEYKTLCMSIWICKKQSGDENTKRKTKKKKKEQSRNIFESSLLEKQKRLLLFLLLHLSTKLTKISLNWSANSTIPQSINGFSLWKSSISDGFRNGWRIRSGEFAKLCHLCGSLIEGGRFCEMFHSSDEGWRDCEFCGKLVHCGCVVSQNAYFLLDSGGVTCMECSKQNFLLARRASMSLDSQIGTDNSIEDITRQIQLEPHYWSRVTDADLLHISQKWSPRKRWSWE